MKRNELKSIGELLPLVLRENGLAEGLSYVEARKVWDNIIPDAIRGYIRHVSIANHCLTAHVTSAALRHELFLNRKKLIADINAKTMPGTITEIKLLS